MKSTIGVCLLVIGLICMNAAQQGDPTIPVLREGIRVQMPVSNQAVEMQAADELDATVVSVTTDGNLFIGTRSAQLSDLAKLNAETVYVKADARVPYQKILAILDALHGQSVALLTAAPSSGKRKGILPPYGVEVTLGHP